MYKVGVMTFHASYNFGTVMQAWATQRTVENLGYECKVINFRPVSQKDKYSLFPLHSGYKLIIRNILELPHIRERYRANKLYERFIIRRLKITQEVNTLEELNTIEPFDIYLSGSDQIWGYHIPEFDTAKEDIRKAYYFSFANGYKVSYASSTGVATYENLLPYQKLLRKYTYLSTRETRGQEIISKLSGKNVKTVLDPTYLISHEMWMKYAAKIPRQHEGDYILIYSLQGLKKAKKWKQIIEQNGRGIDYVTIVPFAPVTGRAIDNRANAGPEEILNLFANAKYILTDTFHGMSFAIHFRKDFTVFEDTEADFRKRNILSMFDLSERETNEINTCVQMISRHIDYKQREKKLSEEISKSKDYLNRALSGIEKYRV